MDRIRERIRNLPFYPRLRRIGRTYPIIFFLGVVWHLWKAFSDAVGYVQNVILMAPYIGDALRTVGAWLNTQAAGNVILGIGLIGILWGLLRPETPASRQIKTYLADKKPEIAAYIKENGAAMVAPKKIIEVRPREVIAATPTSNIPSGTITIQYAVLADVDLKEGRRAQRTETLDITLEGTVQKQEGQYVDFKPHAVIRIR